MAAVAIIVWLQGFSPLCRHLSDGFWRDLCLALTSANARAEGLDGGADIELVSIDVRALDGGQ